MIGNVVNLAARIMQKAQDDILCDRETYDACHTKLDFLEVRQTIVKGFNLPVTLYRPLGRATKTQAPPSPMIGRERELKILTDAIKQLTEVGRGTAVIIEGEAGIGKSKLVEAF